MKPPHVYSDYNYILNVSILQIAWQFFGSMSNFGEVAHGLIRMLKEETSVDPDVLFRKEVVQDSLLAVVCKYCWITYFALNCFGQGKTYTRRNNYGIIPSGESSLAIWGSSVTAVLMLISKRSNIDFVIILTFNPVRLTGRHWGKGDDVTGTVAVGTRGGTPNTKGKVYPVPFLYVQQIGSRWCASYAREKIMDYCLMPNDGNTAGSVATLDNFSFGSNFVLAQYNAPPYTAYETAVFLEKWDVEMMDWIPQSPDMNHTEYVWNQMSGVEAWTTYLPVLLICDRLFQKHLWALKSKSS